jgi:transposase-like protein
MRASPIYKIKKKSKMGIWWRTAWEDRVPKATFGAQVKKVKNTVDKGLLAAMVFFMIPC